MEDDDTSDAKRKFLRYITRAKENISQQQYHDALRYYKKAASIHAPEKLLSKIEKLSKFLKEWDADSDEEDDGDYETVNGFKIHNSCWGKLYAYQKEGVLWFWDLYRDKRGGILGDDMGLGKTIQVIAFLSGMFDQELVKNAIIVAPKSLMENWCNEFEKWAPGIRLAQFHGAKAKREKELNKIQKRNGVILTTYGMVATSYELFSEHQSKRFIWDYIILDEGHKIKNPNKTSKCVRSIPAKNHFILTGTPIQNNLLELWSLVDFVTEGKLLGTKKTFKVEFENPIVRAREKDASSYEKSMGNEISNTLRTMIDKCLLRRTKDSVFGQGNDRQKENDMNAMNSEESSPVNGISSSEPKMDVQLTRKNDLIIWIYLSDIQLQIYQDFLETASVREAMVSTKSPLAQLTMLKKIADHPRLLSSAVCETLGLSQDKETDEDVLIRESSKILFLMKLVKNLKEEDHRVLIFSQSRKMLDIVDKVLTKEAVKLLRFDGRILDPTERQTLIDKFQTDSSITCLLLTTQVGSVGLTLTGADRVVIFDPSWNPGNDAQAVDRVYRIGQNKDVIIYRLITCGTIEEKIYRKQIFKDSISKQTTGSSKNPLRYFARNQLRELFILENPRISETHRILKELNDEKGRSEDPLLKRHLDFLESLDIFGISDHGLVFSKEAGAEANADYDNQIIERAKRAKELIMSEVNLCDQITSLSLNDREIFKPAREDIRRYLPSVNNINKQQEQVENTSIIDERIRIPDSPTTPMKVHATSLNLAADDSMERVSQYFVPEDSEDRILTIEDSLTSTPDEKQCENIDAQYMREIPSNGCGKIDDSYEEASVLDAQQEGESNDIADTLAMTISPGKPKREIDTQNVQSVPSGENLDLSDANNFVEEEEVDRLNEKAHSLDSADNSTLSYGGKSEGDDEPGNAGIEQSLAEGSYTQMTEPYECIKPELITTSPVVSTKGRLFPEVNANYLDGESRFEGSRDQKQRSSEVFRQYRERIGDDSEIEDESGLTDRCNGSDIVGIVNDSLDEANGQSLDKSHGNHVNTPPPAISSDVPVCDSNASFTPDKINDSAGKEATYIEVVDSACSPLNITSSNGKGVASLHAPNSTASDYDRVSFETSAERKDSHEELQTFRELERNLQYNLSLQEDAQKGSHARSALRRSAIGLIYGLAGDLEDVDNNESGVSIEVIDAACSPLSLEEKDIDVVKQKTRRDNDRFSNLLPRARLSACHISRLKEERVISDQPADSPGPPVVSCSTPQDGQAVPVLEHMAVYEKAAGLREALQADRYNSPVEISRRSKGSLRRSGHLSSRSGGMEQEAGSKSLFSHSNLSEAEMKFYEQKPAQQLTASNGGISNGTGGSSHYAESESLFSDHQVTDSKRNSQNGLKFYGKAIAEQSEDRIKFCRSFDLDIQEDTTLPLDHDILIKNPCVSESDSDLQSNRSDQGMISCDDVHIASRHSGQFLQIAGSDHEEANDDDSEIAIKDQQSINHKSETDESENDECSSVDSISSVELGVISALSGSRLSSGNQHVSVCDLIDNDREDSANSDQSDSDDEVLMRSRKQLRRSIMAQPRFSETFDDLAENSNHSMKYQSTCDPSRMEEDDAFNKTWESPTGVAAENCICVRHASTRLIVRRCTCMLSADEQVEYESHLRTANNYMQRGHFSDAVVTYMKALSVADHDLEVRQKVCNLGLGDW